MAKTLKVEITVEEDDGRIIVKTLEGEDAEKWQGFVASVCILAYTHNANPDWGNLRWQKREVNAQSPSNEDI